jgi:hypothetical protein
VKELQTKAKGAVKDAVGKVTENHLTCSERYLVIVIPFFGRVRSFDFIESRFAVVLVSSLILHVEVFDAAAGVSNVVALLKETT